MAVSGSFTATGASDTWKASHTFTISLSGWGEASVVLERSFDGGSTWKAVEEFTEGFEGIVREVGDAATGAQYRRIPVLYRFNCTSFTSGPIDYYVGV